MNKKTAGLLRRFMIAQKLEQPDLIKIMQEMQYTFPEIHEILCGSPKGDKVYVLHGYWNTSDFDGVKIVKISYELEPVEKKLEEIVENKAADYLELHGYLQEDRGWRYYEVTNGSGKYAKFYITEEVVDYEE